MQNRENLPPRNKLVAALLAFTLGTFGGHKLYLRDASGVVFFMFMLFLSLSVSVPITFIMGVVAGFRFLKMSDEEFDRKYNRGFIQRNPEIERRRTRQFEEYSTEDKRRGYVSSAPKIKNNVFKTSGLAKYKEFDLEGAIEDFEKGLALDPNDITLNFQMACAYSLTEQKEKSYKHLAKAVALGFTDFDRILTHDDLAYIRIQKEFDEFKRSGFRTVPIVEKKADAPVKVDQPDPLVLEQLDRLESLKSRGMLNETDYQREYQKLTNR